jgi:hypothetical protein
MCGRSDPAKILVRKVGAARPHQYGSTSRSYLRIFSSFELCDSFNWIYNIHTLTNPPNYQQWQEVVA